jgi:DNA mismatch endonuclease (patch repair protein)
MMGAVRGKNTAPERMVRSAAHALGLRFRLHQADLPGRPDVVLSRHRTVIFVHGCFWHRHTCPRATDPKTRPEFWLTKLNDNRKRDQEKRAVLEKLGWRVIEIWECETTDRAALERRLRKLFALT